MKINKSKVSPSNQLIKQLKSHQLDDAVVSEQFIIIDVRTREGIKKQGSIPGAINIPLDNIKQKLEARKSHIDSIFNRAKSFLFCCTGGVMSYMAAIYAQESGIQPVYNLEGGHSGWKEWKESSTIERMN